MRLIAEMVGQLDLQRPLDQPLGQLAEHATTAENLLLASARIRTEPGTAVHARLVDTRRLGEPLA